MLDACLSSAPDELGQWREYADGGKRLAIGFDMDIQDVLLINVFSLEDVNSIEIGKSIVPMA